jgi:hypothetical protein
MAGVLMYLFNSFKPGFFKTDFRPWSWRSYVALSDEFGESAYGDAGTRAANGMGIIALVLFFGIIMMALPINKRYFDRHIRKYGLSTKGIILKYIPYRSGKYSTSAKVDICFVTLQGDTITTRLTPLKEYNAGDSVTVNYSSKDPSFCELEEQQWRLY